MPRLFSKTQLQDDDDTAAKSSSSSPSTKKQQQLRQHPGCCARLLWEFSRCCSSPLFSLEDNNHTIDARASFSPRGILAVVFKVLSCSATIASLWFGVADDPRVFYLAYLTNWALIMSAIYLLLSCLNTLLPVQQPYTSSSNPGCRVFLTWVFFEVAASAELLVTLLFWTLVYSPGVDDISFVSILGHGGVMLLLLIEGLVINRIPIRLRHWFVLVLPFNILYMGWTVLHAALDVGNPDQMDEDPSTNDDAIYDALNWEENPKGTATLAVLVVCVVSPALYFMLWLMSLYAFPCSYSGRNRRYLDGNSAENYQQMGV